MIEETRDFFRFIVPTDDWSSTCGGFGSPGWPSRRLATANWWSPCLKGRTKKTARTAIFELRSLFLYSNSSTKQTYGHGDMELTREQRLEIENPDWELMRAERPQRQEMGRKGAWRRSALTMQSLSQCSFALLITGGSLISLLPRTLCTLHPITSYLLHNLVDSSAIGPSGRSAPALPAGHEPPFVAWYHLHHPVDSSAAVHQGALDLTDRDRS
nr:hypothetical protein Iba_chr10dCG13980 [Ipomoea batatas]